MPLIQYLVYLEGVITEIKKLTTFRIFIFFIILFLYFFYFSKDFSLQNSLTLAANDGWIAANLQPLCLRDYSQIVIKYAFC
jgi:hypothetical protein